jgi:hypothetical protein
MQNAPLSTERTLRLAQCLRLALWRSSEKYCPWVSKIAQATRPHLVMIEGGAKPQTLRFIES